jgi:hypothetical protein
LLTLNFYEMIQRIQTVYLFLTTLMSVLFLKGSFLNFIDKSESLIIVTLKGILRASGGERYELIEKVLPLSLIIILIPVICIIVIMLFKKRKIQILLSILSIVMVAGLIIASICYSLYIITKYDCDIIPGFKMIIPVVMLILNVLAYRGIKKDDNLIRSYDRLR